jgi:hypothetical protein
MHLVCTNFSIVCDCCLGASCGILEQARSHVHLVMSNFTRFTCLLSNGSYQRDS